MTTGAPTGPSVSLTALKAGIAHQTMHTARQFSGKSPLSSAQPDAQAGTFSVCSP